MNAERPVSVLVVGDSGAMRMRLVGLLEASPGVRCAGADVPGLGKDGLVDCCAHSYPCHATSMARVRHGGKDLGPSTRRIPRAPRWCDPPDARVRLKPTLIS